MNTKKTQTKAPSKLREEELIDTSIIDDAAQAPAPTQVPLAPEAPTSIANPLIPPQPGMVPTGWMFPADSGVAAAMYTGDVNVAGLAPDMIPMEAPEETSDLTSDEEELLKEYRRRKSSRSLREAEEIIGEEYLAPAVPEDVELEEPPVEEELEDEEMSDSDVLSELGDIAVDVAEIFAELGGDPDELAQAIGAEDLDTIEDDEMEDEDAILLDDEEVGDEEMPAFVESFYKKFEKRNLLKEEIKYPVGSGPATVAAAEAKNREIREAMRKFRQARSSKMKEEDLHSGDLMLKNASPEELDDEVGQVPTTQDIIDSTVPFTEKSKVVQSVRKRPTEQFVERYTAKKSWTLKQMLQDGFLG